ncbi:MAG: ABC transporter substrate-binding protein [Vicinamibacterales bacterium]|jgi:phospholipid transport system substrate-binding protein|nr:ABC transporter substrate-binding protein [Vicinamibacterales bacterium]
MHSHCRTLAVVVAILVLASLPPTHALAADEAGVFVKQLGDSAIRLLTANGIADAERESRFRALFRTNFDIERIGRFTLGKHVRRADARQMAEFLKLFEDFIVVTYASRFSEYSGETFEVRSIRAEPGRDTLVLTEILRPSGGPPYRVDWQVRKKDGKLKIIDVKVEGVSMSVTQRAEFASVIQRQGGVNGLIEQLRAKTKLLIVAPSQ